MAQLGSLMKSARDNPPSLSAASAANPQALSPREQKLAAERRRLAEALRENLKRRKMQARERRQSANEEADLDEKP